MNKQRLMELAGIQLNEMTDEDQIIEELEKQIEQTISDLASIWGGDIDRAAEEVQSFLNSPILFQDMVKRLKR